MYFVKLTQLLRAFHISEQNGTVHLEPLQTTGEEPWLAYLHMKQGEVTSCYIHSKKDGRVLLQNIRALQWLNTKEGFVWTLGEDAPSVSNSAVPRLLNKPRVVETDSLSVLQQPETSQKMVVMHDPLEKRKASTTWTPQRMQESIPTTLPRTYVHIFALVDGQRSSEQISALLHISPERVLAILQELQVKRVVR